MLEVQMPFWGPLGWNPRVQQRFVLWGFCYTAGPHRCTVHVMNHSLRLNLIYSKCLPRYRGDRTGRCQDSQQRTSGLIYVFSLLRTALHRSVWSTWNNMLAEGWGNSQIFHNSWLLWLKLYEFTNLLLWRKHHLDSFLWKECIKIQL